ncbi:hypothetical protein [Nevskia sp.]|uniref:hypothetical protein n=1 Tax=Nevskia sp. TaxID=1929292 RepID=UPI0025F07B6F|nr:hypothetical protein [Nevskia sp.]
MPTVLRLLPASAALLISACGSAPDTPYFPLESGRHWTYELHEANPLGEKTETFEITSAGPRERDGSTYYLRRNSLGTEYWLKLDGASIVRSALRTTVEIEPRDDAVPRTVLPIAPKLGDAWEQPSQPFIMERAVPFRERFLHHDSVRFTLAMKITAVDEEVTVPAGTFKHCIKAEGDALIHVLADPRLGGSEVVIRHSEWYAPGVGLIKLHREEPLETTQIVGGEVTMELLSYER